MISPTQPSLGDWLFFAAQIIISVAAIWLTIYLYFRQQKETQNDRYKQINDNLTRLADSVSEIKANVSLIDRATSETQKEIGITHRMVVLKMTDQLVQTIPQIRETKYRLYPVPESTDQTSLDQSLSKVGRKKP